MRIGVIGIGEMGGMLARRWSSNGHAVRVANRRGAAAAREFAEAIGAEAADVPGAVRDADVVLLSIPFGAIDSLPPGLLDGTPERLVVIDTGNYYPGIRDRPVAEIDAGMPESEWVAQRLGRPVVKAFNSILSYTLAELVLPRGTPGRIAVPVAGDPPEGKRIAMNLVDESGFDPVDAGPLAESWRQQPSTPVYCCDYDAETTRRALAAAVPGMAAAVRDGPWWSNHQRLYAGSPDRGDVHRAEIASNRSLNPL